jgi:crotonobetainyl-CoA:carnitine CoA-transferase CaiB-like acyl-CoA transferase
VADARLLTNRGRVEHRAEVIVALSETFRTRTADEWLERLERHGVPAGKVRGVGEAFAAAAAAGDPATLTVEHPTVGALPLIRGPIDVGSTAAPLPPPLLGEHTREILRELGIDPGPLIAAGVAEAG